MANKAKESLKNLLAPSIKKIDEEIKEIEQEIIIKDADLEIMKLEETSLKKKSDKKQRQKEKLKQLSDNSKRFTPEEMEWYITAKEGKRFSNTFYIRESTKKKIQLLAKEKRLSLGEIIDLAIDLYPQD